MFPTTTNKQPINFNAVNVKPANIPTTPPVQMTRAQYQAKYGSPPPAPAEPVKMTRAEYTATYGSPPPGSQPKAPAPAPKPDYLGAAASVVKQPFNPISYLPAAKIGAEAVKNVANIPGQIKDAFQGGVEQFKSGSAAINATAPNTIPRAEAVLKAGSGIASAVASPLAPVMNPIAGLIEQGQEKVTDNPTFQKAALKAPDLPYQRLSESAGNIANIAGTVAGVADLLPRIPGAAKSVVNTATKVGDKAVKLTTPKPVEQVILDSYSRAVKPTIAGKSTLAASEKYKTSVSTAVKTISDNKGNLKFTSEEGVATARPPQSLHEFTQAIDQTKKSIYSQYDTLAKQAGEKGVTVHPQDFIKDLGKVITNKALQISHPEAIEYARTMLKRFNSTEPIDAVTAQSVIENFNAELQAFYRNPSYNQASKVAIDAALVRGLRETLDKAITGSTGTKYQTLKNQYGSLKAIEADVNKAANRVAKLNNKGLADYTDIFSGGDIAAGILTLDPAFFVKGVAQSTIKTWFKSLNSPDKAIKSLFEKADQSQPQSISNATQPTNTPTATATAIPTKNTMSDSITQPVEKATPPVKASSPESSANTIPKAGSVEDLIEKNSGWQPGAREKFDRALLHEDAATIKEMLPSVPKAYKESFKSDIEKVIGKKGMIATAIENIKKGDQRGFARIPGRKPTATIPGAQTYAKEAKAYVKKIVPNDVQQAIDHFYDVSFRGKEIPGGETKAQFYAGVRKVLKEEGGIADVFDWSDNKLTRFVEAEKMEVKNQSVKKSLLVTKELEPLAKEAQKYKSAEEFVRAQTARPDYGYGHSPNADGVPAFDLTAKVDGEQMIPKDMYTQWYGSRGTPSDLESIAALKKVKGNPEAEVTIYRASPKNEWNYGDWTTLSKKYAQEHATGNTGFKVFSKVVKAKDLKWAMDDVNEFGYFPESTKSQLTDLYNKVKAK